MRVPDLIGQRFDRLVVLAKLGATPKDGMVWLCECDCGAQKQLSTKRLRRTKSCGCAAREYTQSHKDGYSPIHNQAKKAGGSASRLYETWNRARCSKEGTSTEWAHFSVFAKDLGEKPSKSHVLMRKDPSQAFSKENCFWASRKEVSANLPTAITLTWKDTTKTVSEWAISTGIRASLIRKRLHAGWSVEDTLSKPSGPIQRLDLIGQKFGRLSVMAWAGSDNRSRSVWHCFCECGKSTVAAGYLLKRGGILSCGCLRGVPLTDAFKPLNKASLAKQLWSRAKSRAIKAGLPFDLDVEDVQIPDTCPILGCPLSRHNLDTTPTIDRLIPSLGYVKSNVAVISWRANSLKKDGSLQEFENLVNWMRERTDA